MTPGRVRRACAARPVDVDPSCTGQLGTGRGARASTGGQYQHIRLDCGISAALHAQRYLPNCDVRLKTHETGVVKGNACRGLRRPCISGLTVRLVRTRPEVPISSTSAQFQGGPSVPTVGHVVGRSRSPNPWRPTQMRRACSASDRAGRTPSTAPCQRAARTKHLARRAVVAGTLLPVSPHRAAGHAPSVLPPEQRLP